MKLQLELNGASVSCDVDPCARLLDVLRNELGAKSVKEGCGEGECGACTVLLDGAPVNACLVLAAQADGCRVTTVESLAQGGALHPIQRAFAETGAVQCGFCTPGFLMATAALLREFPQPSDQQIQHALDGHLCRCTGYKKIMDAVRRAADLAATADAEASARGAPRT